MKDKIIDFLKIAGISLAVLLCVTWTKASPNLNPVWSEALTFFAITYFLCDKYVLQRKLSIATVAIAVAVGRSLPEIIINVADPLSTMGALIITLESLLAIFMACVCWTYKKPVVFLLTLAIFILINSFVPEMWSDFILSRKGL